MTSSGSAPWWRRSVVYQVYVRSFADGNADGTGDLHGLRARLGHLVDLGVDALWLNPWYRSPLHDGGYDVADYRDIDPRFGTLADAEALIADAHALGLKVVADVVPNHTSSEHRWFVDALASEPGSPERARYVFRPGKGPDGSEPPNNWKSIFGGPAWTRLDDGDWYLHLFDVTQPDLNWEHPEVRDEFLDILRFWFDRGVDGFRIDVAHGLVKDPELPDLAVGQELLDGVLVADHPFFDREGVHEIYRGWRSVADEYDGDRVLVAEAWVMPDRLPLYLRPDELHQSFAFDFLQADWDATGLRHTIGADHGGATAVGSVPTWVLSNHDVVRHPTRLGLPTGTDWRSWLLDGPHEALDAELGLRRARAATAMMLALPGAAYLYQGEELGLHEVHDLPVEVLDDPVWERSGRTRKGRDGCRVPLPWSAEGPSFGFSENGSWLPQPDWYGPVSVAAQTGVDGSTLELYRTLLRLRRELLVDDEELEWLEPESLDSLVFRRGSGVVCVVNLGDGPRDLPDGEVLVATEPLVDGRLPSDATAWIR